MKKGWRIGTVWPASPGTLRGILTAVFIRAETPSNCHQKALQRLLCLLMLNQENESLPKNFK